MISLTNNNSTSTQKLQAFLSGAAATTNPKVVVHSYIVLPNEKPGFEEYRSAPQFTTLAGATETDIADAPVSGSVKDVHQISIYNADTASVTVTVCIDQNGTNNILVKTTLLTGETLHYEGAMPGGRGWYATDANANIKTSLAAATNWAISGNLTVSGNTTLGDAAADSLTINAGVYSAPNIPAFAAYVSANINNVTGNNTTYTVLFDAEIFDQNSNYAPGTGIFTAPVTGRYLFASGVRMTGLTALATIYQVNLITSNRNWQFINLDRVLNTDDMACGGSAVIDMDAGDTAKIQVVVSGMGADNADVFGSSNAISYFSGHQVA